MSAAMELHVALSLRLDAIEAYRLAHAYRDEVLAKAAADTVEAYPGELAMLHGLIATLRAVADHGDLTDVRKLLDEHQRDDAQARAEGKSSRTPADATARQTQLLTEIRLQGGRWKAGRAHRALTDLGFEVSKGTAGHDLAQLAAGYLVRHDEPGVTYYTVPRQTSTKGGTA
ncbi:hypothetical protein ACFYQA_08525 [Streptomyces sp. NPDC005774]|uniref:hypothetical protein n=1 Tax=Streptomyces sp. NPDC005774 TaxID=3364728 RepID=UPI0036BD8D47